MEFSSSSPVHQISCIYSQLAHLSQFRWVGSRSPSGSICLCWKTPVSSNVRRLQRSYKNLPKSSETHQRSKLNLMVWLGHLQFLKYSRYIPHRHTFHMLFPVFLIIVIKHQLWPTNWHLAGIKKLHQQTRCHAKKQAKTGLNKTKNFTNLAFFMRKNSPKKSSKKLGPWVPSPLNLASPAVLAIRHRFLFFCVVSLWAPSGRSGKRPERNDSRKMWQQLH